MSIPPCTHFISMRNRIFNFSCPELDILPFFKRSAHAYKCECLSLVKKLVTCLWNKGLSRACGTSTYATETSLEINKFYFRY